MDGYWQLPNTTDHLQFPLKAFKKYDTTIFYFFLDFILFAEDCIINLARKNCI